MTIELVYNAVTLMSIQLVIIKFVLCVSPVNREPPENTVLISAY